MPPKDVERMANGVDPDQTAPVCSDIHVPIFRIFTVHFDDDISNSNALRNIQPQLTG